MLSEKIKERRREKGLSQQELAEALSVVRQTVSKWEQGLSVPDTDMLVKIAEVLEISVSELLDEKGAPESTPMGEEKKVRALPLSLIIIGSPIWVALGLAALSVIISLYAALWSLIVSAWAVFGAFAGGGIGGLVGGIVIAVTNNPVAGLVLVAGGLLSSGLSIFSFFGARAATKGAVKLSVLTFTLIKKLLKGGGSNEQN